MARRVVDARAPNTLLTESWRTMSASRRASRAYRTSPPQARRVGDGEHGERERSAHVFLASGPLTQRVDSGAHSVYVGGQSSQDASTRTWPSTPRVWGHVKGCFMLARRRSFSGIASVVLCLTCVAACIRSSSEPALDEARRAGRTAESLRAADEDYFGA